MLRDRVGAETYRLMPAKRLFALFSGGAALGAVVGGTLVSVLSGVVGVQQLYLVWAGLAVVTLPETGVGGYHNTVLDMIFNLLGAALAVTIYVI